ncbi:hypothetical protein [Alkalicoccus luteus]|uniref:Uncharacterized protein n=1 Tax=Alkalicoccus luteus TaxID=1237094 RepID=A0A969TV40_9BACI|nr:hypothetical protein [Alkalicoccus luteus]NJP39368.1 hypothetical protein [Alkalicoccus luteus]
MSENNNLTPEQEVAQWKDAFSGKQNPAYQQTVEERIKQRVIASPKRPE